MAYSVHCTTDDRIQRARSYCDLQDKLVSVLPKSCNLLQLTAFHPDNSFSTENMLKDLVKSEEFHMSPLKMGSCGSSVCGHKEAKSVLRLLNTTSCSVAKHYIILAVKPEHHPSLLNIINTVVLYNFEDAYRVLQELESLPSSHSEVYRWPRDLLTPDLVVLLPVSPEDRAWRLHVWGVEKTREEAELEENNLFRQK
ncbi:UMP-CMP kinase 2, mitochondrial [Acipenser ruthenus]|uniref:UMP-CMP kinase 2, mitochondrial n=1 Tax=Acipenser ruthenus TaxID=7906 RepID=A0A662YVT7_ACIRT|nr:UMP-CMP kinase 2, mitochondrial [Acipenser ruthenus]